MNNLGVYSRKDVVEKYSLAEKMQLPEVTLINLVGERLKTFRLLDLGVGGGRTTLHFSDKVLEYIGTDYSKEMVEACKKRFQDKKELSFQLVDASNLGMFTSNSFDLVLFSFNGIDYLDESKRSIAIDEAYRVLKKGGIYFFSTHNTQSIKKLFMVHPTYNIPKMLWRICRYFLLTFINGQVGKLTKLPTVSINDGAWGFGLNTIYISPKKQLEDLKQAGFQNLKLFSIGDGTEIPTESLEKNEESRIYYYAEK